MSLQCVWTRQQKLKFVQEYVKHKSLLITGLNDETKKRKLLRKAALTQISKTMNLPCFGPKEAYKKFRNIKSTYAQELKKIKNATSRGNKYVSNLIWFNTLHKALDAIDKEDCTCTKPSESYADINDLSDIPEANADSIKDEIFEEAEDSAINASNYLEEEEQISIDRENPIMIKVYGVQNYANSLTDTAVDNMSNTDDSSDATSNDLIATHIRSEFDVFGESVGAQLKNMPLPAQMYIQNYLSSLRLQALRRQNP